MRDFIPTQELDKAQLVNGGKYSDHHMVLRVPLHRNIYSMKQYGNLLFDKHMDPNQDHPLKDEKIEAMMIEKLKCALVKTDAPEWQMERLGLNN